MTGSEALERTVLHCYKCKWGFFNRFRAKSKKNSSIMLGHVKAIRYVSTVQNSGEIMKWSLGDAGKK